MAKLGARGRTELLRMVKENHTVDKDDTITWNRHTIVFMSDMTVLTKYDVRFKPTPYDPKGRLHSYGWKRKGKYGKEFTMEERQKRYENSGWKLEK